MTGAEDGFSFPETAPWIVESIPDARLHLIDNVGQNAFYGSAREILSTVYRKFLQLEPLQQYPQTVPTCSGNLLIQLALSLVKHP